MSVARMVPLAAMLWLAEGAFCVSVLGAAMHVEHETLPAAAPEAPAAPADGTSTHHDEDDSDGDSPEPVST